MTDKATYRRAGVDIDAGERAVELMKKSVASTLRPEVIGDLGGFGGLCSLPAGYSEPVLVAATDGVGTKLKIAQALGEDGTVGIDLVAMCVNDILAQGAEPLFFLDYLAVGKLEPERAAEIVAGVADGCRQAGCALLGGETAEMPGFYAPGEYDLAGFAVGVMERERARVLDGSSIVSGDKLIGLASSGVHSNGYSLIRYLIKENRLELSNDFDAGTLGAELLKPTKIYVKALLPAVKDGPVKGLAHITGGGLTNNIPRILPDGATAAIDLRSWSVPRIFRYIQELGGVADEEMRATFNLGIGMVAVVSEEEVAGVLATIEAAGETASVIGEIERGERTVRYEGA